MVIFTYLKEVIKMTEVKKNIKRFPLKLEVNFSEEVDSCVFYSKSPSKHQYIIDALREQVKRDGEKFNLSLSYSNK
jgi:hypothetical protein